MRKCPVGTIYNIEAPECPVDHLKGGYFLSPSLMVLLFIYRYLFKEPMEKIFLVGTICLTLSFFKFSFPLPSGWPNHECPGLPSLDHDLPPYHWQPSQPWQEVTAMWTSHVTTQLSRDWSPVMWLFLATCIDYRLSIDPRYLDLSLHQVRPAVTWPPDHVTSHSSVTCHVT